MLLHLQHPVARAGKVRQSEALADHTVEAGGFEPPQPLLRGVRVAGRGRDAEAAGEALEGGAALLERAQVHRLASPEQDVEGDEFGRQLGREPADAALGGVQAELHRVEVEPALTRDHHLTVEGRVRREDLPEPP